LNTVDIALCKLAVTIVNEMAYGICLLSAYIEIQLASQLPFLLSFL